MAENQDSTVGNENLEGVDATQLAAMVGSVPEEELAVGMSNPEGRALVLDEIFKRMAEHVEPTQIEGVDAVVHFRITDAPGGGDDVYEVVIKDGGVSVNKDASQQAKVTITVGPVPFLKLVTGHQSGPVMFMTGKLKLAGDVMFAARITSFFRIPTAAG